MLKEQYQSKIPYSEEKLTWTREAIRQLVHRSEGTAVLQRSWFYQKSRRVPLHKAEENKLENKVPFSGASSLRSFSLGALDIFYMHFLLESVK